MMYYYLCLQLFSVKKLDKKLSKKFSFVHTKNVPKYINDIIMYSFIENYKSIRLVY